MLYTCIYTAGIFNNPYKNPYKEMSLGYGMDRYLFYIPKNLISQVKIELKLERPRSEDTPRRLMITHTIDQFILLTSSYRIPSQNKVKAEKLKN